MKLVMTLLVRNEEDILVMNLEHHLSQGVDFFIVTNNCSVDSTPKILQTYVDRGLMEVIDEPSDTYAQAVWVTRMAQRAVQLSADWIFHADADEFWVATQPGCLLRDVIPELSRESPLWNVDRWNAALHVGDDEQDWINPALVKFFDTQSINQHGHSLPPKVLHRAQAGIQVAQGNHSVVWPSPGVTPHECRDLVILHFPYQGYQNYEKKIVQGGRAYSANPDLSDAVGSTWRKDYLSWMAGLLPATCKRRLVKKKIWNEMKSAGRLRLSPNPLVVQPISFDVADQERFFDADEGVICLADENYFFGVRLLYHSLRQKRPLTVYDLGLSNESRQWVSSCPDIRIRAIPQTALISAIRNACGTSTMQKRTKREWPLWICPELILDAPYRQVAWIDADAIVLRGINKMFSLIKKMPFITQENLAPEQTANPPELLEKLPLGHQNPVEDILLNAGVSGWCLDRDRSILEGYNYPIRRIFQAGALSRDAVRWHDQGCLIWALQNAGFNSSILRPKQWNCCVKHSRLSGWTINPVSDDDEICKWLETARRAEPDAKIVHWNGHAVPWG